MNNLFHAGNTFCKTQRSSVEKRQSTDWGVLNYSCTTLGSNKRNTISLSFQKLSLLSARLSPDLQTQIEPFYLWKEAARKPAEWVVQRAEPHLCTVCCVCSNSTALSTVTTYLCCCCSDMHLEMFSDFKEKCVKNPDIFNTCFCTWKHSFQLFLSLFLLYNILHTLIYWCRSGKECIL